MNRRTLALPALAGLLASVLAACSGTEGGGGKEGSIVVGTTDTFAVTKDATAPFDPAAAYDVGSWNVMRNTFQTLLRLPRSGTAPVGDAASRCGFTDRRDQEYRCTLREGLTFSNGDRLDAEDVAFSVKRMLRIHYANGPYNLLSGVDKAEAVNDDEIVFHLKRPDATFPSKLATPAASIVDSQVYPADGFLKGVKVVGSGPYTLGFQKRQERARFTANPRYKGSVKVRSHHVELRSFPNASAMEKALTSGSIDMVNRSISPREVEKLQADPGGHVKLVEQPGQEIRYLVFNTEDHTAGQSAVRRAVAQTVDRQALVRDVYARTSEPLYSIVPSGLPGHRVSFFNRYGDPDPRAARRTLREAGVRAPVKLTLSYTSDHYGEVTEKEFAELKKQLDATGLFDVRIKGVPWGKYRPAAFKGDYQVYGYGWFPDFPDADNYIAPFFAKNNFLGSSFTSHAIRDELIPQTRREDNRAATARAFGRAQDIVASKVPILPLWQGKEYVAARDDITGTEWALNSSSGLQLWELDRGATG